MPTKKSRTKPQYGQFRKAFKKWRAKYVAKAVYYSSDKDGRFELYDENKSSLATYVAPGYSRYMEHQFRGIKSKRTGLSKPH